MVKKRDDLELPAVPETCNPELAQLINSCLCIDRTKRPTFEQIVKILEYLFRLKKKKTNYSIIEFL